MGIYELSQEMNIVAENLEAALAWQPSVVEGLPVDDEGNVINDVEKYRADLLEAWETTLEGIDGEFSEKIGNIASYIKNLKSDCEELKREETALKNRRTVKENALKIITAFLMEQMQAAGKSKVDTPRAAVSIRNNAESVVIDNETAFIAWAKENAGNLLKYAQPEIRKIEVKALLKAGEKVPEAHLTRTQSLVVK